MIYDDYKVYGPYLRKDNRKHVILIKHDENGHIIDRITCSYPKYIVENIISKKLNKNETVDHIDEDFTNNNQSNLRIVPRDIHCRSHASKRKRIIKQCVICGISFITSNNKQITCGDKHCVGKCAHVDGYNKGNHYKKGKNKLVSLRDTIKNIKPVKK